MSEFVPYSPEIFDHIVEIPLNERISQIEAIHRTVVAGSVRRIEIETDSSKVPIEVSGWFYIGNLPLFFKAWRVGPEREVYYLRHVHEGMIREVYTKWWPHQPSYHQKAPSEIKMADESQYREFMKKYNQDPSYRLFISAAIVTLADKNLLDGEIFKTYVDRPN